MECHCFRASQLPLTSKLFVAFVEDFQQVAGFYSHPPTLEAILASAQAVRVADSTRRAVVEVLREQNHAFGADAASARSLQRLAAGAVAVVTGQQVGLFSGPAYSFYKALTAIHLAAQLTERGTDAVPVFWLATEDHDLAEISYVDGCDSRGRLHRVKLAEPIGSTGQRVGEVELGNGAQTAVDTVLHWLGGPDESTIGDAVRESYSADATFGTAFGRLMSRLLHGRGIILLDPLDFRLQQLAAPVYERALEEAVALDRELLARGKQLERAGFHSQVKVTERSTVAFLNVDGRRTPLRLRNDGFAAGHATFSSQELLMHVAHAPHDFSSNVLLRPVVQDCLLPTAAYVAGPAEIAYFAQAEVVYRRLGVRMPGIVPRAGFTLIEPRIARLLKKYDLSPPDFFRGRQHVRQQLERGFLPRGLERRFSSGEKQLRKILSGLRGPVTRLDKTLAGAVETAARKMLYQYEKLRKKAGRAEGFRGGLLDEHERLLQDALYPHRSLQERSHCLLPYLARHGLSLLDTLEARAEVGNQHQVLYL